MKRFVRQACDEGRVIITSDRDFGELVFRHGARPPGVMLLRIRANSAISLRDAFVRQWPNLEAKAQGHFLVVGRSRMRIRKFPAAF